MASSRFPGKPLAMIHGLTMIQHVFERARLSRAMDQVCVATCDEAIVQAVEGFGGKAIMTSEKHERGTDRVAEAAAHLGSGADDIIVNVQGDEPMLDPEMLDAVVRPLFDDPGVQCTNLISPLPNDQATIEDPNIVKAVVDPHMDALYFSRSVLPGFRYAPLGYPRFRQLGIYAFRRPALEKFVRLPPTPLESAESVDMMRLLEHRVPLRCAVTEVQLWSVDNPGDIAIVEEHLATDPLRAKYGLGRRWP
jgi:3-deoxy-manno-octulosonate cytidylyltransferase (CMP-KDO synthetase)